MLISEIFSFTMDKKHGVTLSNMFFKNVCLFESPKSTKEPAKGPDNILTQLHFLFTS